MFLSKIRWTLVYSSGWATGAGRAQVHPAVAVAAADGRRGGGARGVRARDRTARGRLAPLPAAPAACRGGAGGGGHGRVALAAGRLAGAPAPAGPRPPCPTPGLTWQALAAVRAGEGAPAPLFFCRCPPPAACRRGSGTGRCFRRLPICRRFVHFPIFPSCTPLTAIQATAQASHCGAGAGALTMGLTRKPWQHMRLLFPREPKHLCLHVGFCSKHRGRYTAPGKGSLMPA